MIDVGGGHGRLLATILERNPRLRGILFDQPHVIEGARPTLDAAGVADRCELVGGSFFEAVPTGGDAYILRNIIHDWEDDQAVAILTNCRRAMADGRASSSWSDTSPTIPARRSRLFTPTWRCSSTSGDGSARRTSMRHSWRAAVSDSPRRSLWGALAEAMGHYLIEAQPV